ncbi:alpha/beta hydrolase-fold protein [Streptomyces sp. NPDC050738]|uniref:alpha/beta hydrolase n=1 Tax=Streptomyces sp. NPDC050738 TaxID=3154744 RepID=UPI00343B515C
MSLTGTPFFLTTIVLTVVAVVLPLVLWSRVRGPAAVRGGARLVMLVFAQAAAVMTVFVAVNNSNGLYDNWADLLGTGNHIEAAPNLGDDGLGGKKMANEPVTRQEFKAVHDGRMGSGVKVTQLHGPVSKVKGEVYVWLPPQYSDPAYRNRKFPVVELLGGYPGSPKSWFGTLHVNTQLASRMKRGDIAPFILVQPRTNVLSGQDAGCANVPGIVNADSWLSVDVRKMVTDNFRAQTGAKGWAVAGYSAGAHCAVKLALAHPDRYRAAVGLSGYNDPAAEKDSITAKDPQLRKVNNPLWILKHAKIPPHVALFVTGRKHDGYLDGLALQRAAKSPTSVQVGVAGAHVTSVWRAQVPGVFRWLTLQLASYPGRTAPAKGI